MILEYGFDLFSSGKRDGNDRGFQGIWRRFSPGTTLSALRTVGSPFTAELHQTAWDRSRMFFALGRGMEVIRVYSAYGGLFHQSPFQNTVNDYEYFAHNGAGIFER